MEEIYLAICCVLNLYKSYSHQKNNMYRYTTEDKNARKDRDVGKEKMDFKKGS